MNIYVSPTTELEVKRLYALGLSAKEVKEELGLRLSVRQLQRWLRAWGLSRGAAEAFRLARKKRWKEWRKNRALERGLR